MFTVKLEKQSSVIKLKAGTKEEAGSWSVSGASVEPSGPP